MQREVLDIMIVEEKVRGKTMQRESTLRAADEAAKTTDSTKPQSTGGKQQINYIAKTITIRDDQFDDVTSMAAYNKLKRREPDTVSSVVREALDMYIAQADDAYRYI
jgi:hypothetical protein